MGFQSFPFKGDGVPDGNSTMKFCIAFFAETDLADLAWRCQKAPASDHFGGRVCLYVFTR